MSGNRNSNHVRAFVVSSHWLVNYSYQKITSKGPTKYDFIILGQKWRYNTSRVRSRGKGKGKEKGKSEGKFWVKHKLIASTQAGYQTFYPPQKWLVLYRWCTWTGDIISQCVRPVCDLIWKLCQFRWKLDFRMYAKKKKRLHCFRWMVCQLINAALVDLELARVGLVTLRANRNLNFKASSFSFKCQTAFRKLLLRTPGIKDRITKTSRPIDMQRAVPFTSCFFYYWFWALWGGGGMKSQTHIEAKPRDMVVRFWQPFTITCPGWHCALWACSVLFPDKVIQQFSLHIMFWHNMSQAR